MARPSKTVGKTKVAKARKARSVKGRKPGKTKRRIAPTAIRSKRSSASAPGTELKEAREQQAATAEILKVIASSPSNVQPVFDAIAKLSNRLIGGSSTAVFSVVDDMLYLMSFTSVNPAADAALKAITDTPLSAYSVADAMRNHDVSQISDTETEGMPAFLRDVARQRGWRSALTVPMVREGELVGTIAVTKVEPGLFDDHHVKLLQTFADQAVIAIQNVRLFDEVQAKTRDLEQSLQQQTATADVLKVISRSAVDLQTVLQTLVDSAANLCEAESAHIFRCSNMIYKLAACCGYSREYEEHMKPRQLKAGRDSIIGRIALEHRIVHVPDVLADPEYSQPEAQRLGRWRTVLGVPLMREGAAIGGFTLTRSIVKPFTEKHRVSSDFRRSSRNRDRECSTVR